MKYMFAVASLLCFVQRSVSAEPVLLDDQFKLPANFHIYKAADASLTGGTYDITFDGQGRLLVGDGKAVRRLTDSNNDQLYDKQEVIAEGLGGRGPQGLLVYGDRLYAVGGDGIQLFSGYQGGGPLKHEGRLGQPFHTGGDHSAHTVLRGLDGYIYFVCGDGGGTSDRKHITEESSPVIYERNASVFRFDPDGEYWECISAGGRNPPSLGMNYLGEFFSFDSDMEWHVELPWYRPVRLNHWAIGGDQGWQGVGAYPPYYIDNLPPVLEVGRGSPNWGIFYEHDQLPEQYADSFLCCDYRWKSATTGGYNSSGRLVAFHMTRDGASWKAEMETLAETIPNAKDEQGRSINFALVDVDVAPDGSLFVSDHNQGVWRIFYSKDEQIPPVIPQQQLDPRKQARIQPGSEWSRLRMEEHFASAGEGGVTSGPIGSEIQRIVLNAKNLRARHTALRLLAPQFKTLSNDFLNELAADEEAEIRAQAAWLYGIRRNENEVTPLIRLLADSDPFVRRRAAEALGRKNSPAADEALVKALDDKFRAVRYAAMTAIAHRPLDEWFDLATNTDSPRVWMRALVAGSIRREKATADDVAKTVQRLLDAKLTSKEDRLDLLRVIGLYRDEIVDTDIRSQVTSHITSGLSDADHGLLWEHTRLAGDYGLADAVDPLLAILYDEQTEDISRFHVAQALSKIESGWSDNQSDRLFEWLVTTQEGWFSEFDGKGVQFRQFWSAILDPIVDRHPSQVAEFASMLKPSSQLSGMAYGVLANSPSGRGQLAVVFDGGDAVVRRDVVNALSRQETHESLWPMMLQGLSSKDSQASLAEWIEKQEAPIARFDKHLSGVSADGMSGEQLVSYRLISLLDERRHAQRAGRALETLYSDRVTNSDYREEETRVAAQERWQPWYRDRYGVPYISDSGEEKQRLSDDRIHELLLEASGDGDVARGRKVYLEANCFSCHGGIADKQASVFGPDLAGVSKRLKPEELADSIVYPSKQVAERFRNTMVVTTDGDVLTGVLTEKNEKQLVLVNKDNEVSRVKMDDVDEVKLLETSPMPEQALNRFKEEQVRDLLAFLKSLN